MLIISEFAEFKNNIIQIIYIDLKIRKQIITTITKSNKEQVKQDSTITESIGELNDNLDEFINFRAYEENTLQNLKHIDNFISKTIYGTDINETNFNKIQDIRSDLIVSLYENEENKTRNNEILTIAKDNNSYIKALFEKQQKNEIEREKETIKILLTNYLESYGLKTETNTLKQAEFIGKLAHYLNNDLGVILREKTNDIYILDKETNGYNKISLETLKTEVSRSLNIKNLLNIKDLEKSLGFLDDYLKPTYNKIKFNNCIYDIEEHKPIQTEKPVFTLIESKYNYNPEAKGKLIYDYLYSSLARETEEETEKAVQGLKQALGYLFTSGNKHTVILLLLGISGSGKSIFANILTEIFGAENVANLSLYEMSNYTHGTSSLANKTLNLITDSDTRIIEDNGMIKTLSGNDSMPINPKGKDLYSLPPQEVPKTVLIGNSMPKFKNLETALIDRFMPLEFKTKFRGTSKQNPNLLNDILANKEEIESLIYESLEAYKEIKHNTDFILKLSEEETKEIILKHEKPLNYLISKVILKYDAEAYITECYGNEEAYIFNDELNKILIKLAEAEGLDLKLNKKGLIDSRKLTQAIKTEFDLFDTTIQYKDNFYSKYQTINERTSKGQKRIYPNLIKKPLYDEILKTL